jgi:hypothetical protein
MSDRRKPDPNATIQLDALDPGELEDAIPAARESSVSGARKGPPPLPPQPMAAPGMPAAGPPAPASAGKKVGLVALFVVLLAAAITGGLLVGTRVRPTTAQTTPQQQPAAPPSQSPSASAAPTAETLTIPTIEMK